MHVPIQACTVKSTMIFAGTQSCHCRIVNPRATGSKSWTLMTTTRKLVSTASKDTTRMQHGQASRDRNIARRPTEEEKGRTLLPPKAGSFAHYPFVTDRLKNCRQMRPHYL